MYNEIIWMTMKNNVKLKEGSVGKTIIRLTLPMMIGIVSMVIFNIVDTWFISKLGTAQLAAMSFTLPVIMLLGCISMGLGLGVSTVISRAIGSNNSNQVKRLTTDSLFLSITLVLLVVGVGLLTINPLFSAMGANKDMLELIKQYMFVWYLGVPFVVIPMIGNNAIRAAGNTVIPSAIMLVAILINIILDPLLIFGIGPFPRLELVGAAIATVAARATTLIVSLLILHFKFNMLTSKIPRLVTIINSWKSILFIGIPAAITHAIIPLSIGIIMRMVTIYGKEAIAAFGVGYRIEMFALSPLRALGVVLVPFTGQNIGAGKIDRVKKGIHFSWMCSMLVGFIMFVLFVFKGKTIGALFNSDPQVISFVYLYLIIVSITYGMQGIFSVSSASFNALNKPFHSALLNLLRMIIFYIPLAWIGAQILGLKGIFIASSLSSLFTGLIAIFWINHSINRMNVI